MKPHQKYSWRNKYLKADRVLQNNIQKRDENEIELVEYEEMKTKAYQMYSWCNKNLKVELQELRINDTWLKRF